MLKNKTIMNYGTISLLVLLIATISLISVALATNKVENEIEGKLIEIKQDEFIKPLEGEFHISAIYGKRVHPITGESILHNGIDLAANKGATVVAIADGMITKAGYESSRGNYVEIKHQSYTSEYNHLSQITLAEGTNVKAGDKIGEVGATGYATGPHLHLSLKNEENEYVDPSEYISLEQ